MNNGQFLMLLIITILLLSAYLVPQRGKVFSLLSAGSSAAYSLCSFFGLPVFCLTNTRRVIHK